MAEVIQLFTSPRPPHSTISDEQYNTEIALMQKLRDAKAAFLAACDEINENSGFRSINMTAVRESLEDELPNGRNWQNDIDDARRGYITAGIK